MVAWHLEPLVKNIYTPGPTSPVHDIASGHFLRVLAMEFLIHAGFDERDEILSESVNEVIAVAVDVIRILLSYLLIVGYYHQPQSMLSDKLSWII